MPPSTLSLRVVGSGLEAFFFVRTPRPMVGVGFCMNPLCPVAGGSDDAQGMLKKPLHTMVSLRSFYESGLVSSNRVPVTCAAILFRAVCVHIFSKRRVIIYTMVLSFVSL